MKNKTYFVIVSLLFALAMPALLTAQTVYILYDASNGDLPEDDGHFYYQALSLSGSNPTVQTGANSTGNYVNLNTLSNNDISAGYTTVGVTITFGLPPGYITGTKFSPTLDPAKGFALTFTSEILTETHATAARAGFSAILLDQNARGIEIAFWENEVWAQSDTFTHAEGVAFDTTSPITYRLAISGTTYTLTADDTPILSGTTRTYPTDSLSRQVYGFPNFIFLGDNTSSAAASFRLYGVTLAQDTLGGTLAGTADLPGRVDDSGSWTVGFYDTAVSPTTLAFSRTVTSDTSGAFTVPNIPAGTYTVTLKHPQGLQTVQTATFSSGTTTPLDFGVQQMGDINNDNLVNINDLSLFASVYGTNDPTADFNNDGLVNILDLSLFASSYNQSGELP